MLLTIKCVLNFIEEYSEIFWIIITVAGGSLWLNKFLKQKRAEAFFGFYTQLSMQLKDLRTRLEEKGRLETSDPQKGNIYSLIYEEKYAEKVSTSYPKIDERELNAYLIAAAAIEKTLLDTDSNVYPKSAKQREWYNSLHIVFSFCEFLIHKEYQHTTNESNNGSTDEAKHITKCKLLVSAIDYILNSIKREKY